MEAGRPTKYLPEYNEQVTKLCKLGATDKDLADFFGVCEKTINNWKEQHPDFLQSIKEGKEIADATVADSLFKRSTGYSHDAIHFSQSDGFVTETPYIKHYPPDSVAAMFWLKNRRPKDWMDRKQMDVTSGGEKLTKGIVIVAPDKEDGEVAED